MSEISSRSRSSQGQSQCLCVNSMHTPCLPSFHGPPLALVIPVDPEKMGYDEVKRNLPCDEWIKKQINLPL